MNYVSGNFIVHFRQINQVQDTIHNSCLNSSINCWTIMYDKIYLHILAYFAVYYTTDVNSRVGYICRKKYSYTEKKTMLKISMLI